MGRRAADSCAILEASRIAAYCKGTWRRGGAWATWLRPPAQPRDWLPPLLQKVICIRCWDVTGRLLWNQQHYNSNALVKYCYYYCYYHCCYEVSWWLWYIGAGPLAKLTSFVCVWNWLKWNGLVWFGWVWLGWVGLGWVELVLDGWRSRKNAEECRWPDGSEYAKRR